MTFTYKRRAAAALLAAALLFANFAGCVGGTRTSPCPMQTADADAVAVEVIRADFVCVAAGSAEGPVAGAFSAWDDVPLDADLQAVLWEACEEYGVEYALALGLMEVESSFREDAVSAADCYGLMQLNPKYFPSSLSPEDNIRYGVAFLAEKIAQYDGDLEAALTAYNAGHDTGDREYAENVLTAAENW